MIGNNACGTRALGYGRTSDNLLGVKAITGTGAAWDAPAVRRSARVRSPAPVWRPSGPNSADSAGRFRVRAGESVAENGFGAHRLLAGSEGTLAVITEATVRLVSEPAHRVLVLLGYPDIAAAGDATPQVLTYGPVACGASIPALSTWCAIGVADRGAAAAAGCGVAVRGAHRR